MNVIIVTTYNIPYLQLSLSSLRRYFEQNKLYEFCLAIHNDNPIFQVKESFVRRFISEELIDNEHLAITNVDKNLGCFEARINAFYQAWFHFNMYPIKYFMYLDDDDVILNPDFSLDALEISQRYCAVSRLLEVLYLIQNPSPNFDNEFITDNDWKLGNVGVVLDWKMYKIFLDYLKDFLPQFYKFVGSERIMSPDDLYFSDFWHVYLSTFVDENLENLIKTSWNYSIAQTYIEDRCNRYEVSENVIDYRYGKIPGSSEGFFGQLRDAKNLFYNYCKSTKS